MIARKSKPAQQRIITSVALLPAERRMLESIARDDDRNLSDEIKHLIKLRFTRPEIKAL